MTLDGFFEGWDEARRLFEVIRGVVDEFGPVDLRAGKSQIAFTRRRAFAWAWIPDRYLHGAHAPLVLTLSLRRHDASPRWTQVVEPAPGRFTHHLELHGPEDIDAEVRAWLSEAWESAA